MSSPESTSSRAGIGVITLLAGFAGFAILLYLAQVTFGGSGEVVDPRSPERLAIKAEVSKEQKELLAKMGLADEKQRQAVFEKAIVALQARKPAKSSVVVPGSPTQLKQMAAEAPAASPAPTTSGTDKTPAK